MGFRFPTKTLPYWVESNGPLSFTMKSRGGVFDLAGQISFLIAAASEP